ncbi:STARD3 N-terminal-like protein isoform X2 [Buteo buteo]|uniref:STARD3 N-terminal-like protein isoform X2 n=1 Tax=Buteo buteo TaxID=30397 RepID=UPI003EBF9B09
MNRVPGDAENAHSSSVESCPSLRDVHSINPAQLMARIESYEGREKKGISDVRRTFCLFVTFDLLFITLLWIIELNVKGGIETTLEKEVLQYDYSSSYFDIFFTTAVTSAFLLAKVIISKLFSQGAFGYVLPIISFILAWIETWFLDFKVLPQEAEEENTESKGWKFNSLVDLKCHLCPVIIRRPVDSSKGFLIAQDASERAALLHPGVLSDGQFYSPPESVAGSDEDSEEKQDSEKPVV